MASGRLGAVEPAASTLTALYSPGANVKASVVVKAVNRAAAARAIRIAVIDGAVGSVADEDYVTYDLSLAATGDADEKDKYEETGFLVSGTQTIAVYADGIDVSFVAMGEEEAI